jgi:hypothetical protein
MQDIGSVVVIDTLLAGYTKGMSLSKLRDRYSSIAKSQLRIIALLTTALASFGLGAIKHGGIGKVNIPVFLALGRETLRLMRLNERDIKMISKRNDGLEARLATIERAAGIAV